MIRTPLTLYLVGFNMPHNLLDLYISGNTARAILIRKGTLIKKLQMISYYTNTYELSPLRVLSGFYYYYCKGMIHEEGYIPSSSIAPIVLCQDSHKRGNLYDDWQYTRSIYEFEPLWNPASPSFFPSTDCMEYVELDQPVVGIYSTVYKVVEVPIGYLEDTVEGQYEGTIISQTTVTGTFSNVSGGIKIAWNYTIPFAFSGSNTMTLTYSGNITIPAQNTTSQEVLKICL